jgi:glycosylphosphatidylinositol transamidase
MEAVAAVAAALSRYGSPDFPGHVEETMEALGLEVYQSRFHPRADSSPLGPAGSGIRSWWGSLTQSSPAAWQHSNSSDSSSGDTCITLHGILRSKRGDGKEALVLVTPLGLSPSSSRPGSGSEVDSAGTASLLLGSVSLLLSALQHSTWLGKDLIWVVPDANCRGGSLQGLRHWACAYQLPGQGGCAAPLLPFGRAGVMQQAVVVEAPPSVCPGGRYDSFEVLLEGDNGQLPKLDMFHLLSSLGMVLPATQRARGGNVGPVRLLDRLAWSQGSRAYLSKLLTMSGVMVQQASAQPSGPHAAFKEFLVDAATMQLSRSGDVSRD